jgi:hypothetical protein
VAIVGHNSVPDLRFDDAQLTALKRYGFNTVQLNIAWGPRPADEPLNLEDVLTPSGEVEASRVAERRAEIARRAEACKRHGLRTIFHFGAPRVEKHIYRTLLGPDSTQAVEPCIQAAETVERYRCLLSLLAEACPLVDDLLVYTYDQDAWLCGEFGTCPRCGGVPLHERLPSFLTALRDTWVNVRPDGTVWWEPWELSAGQTVRMVDRLPAHNFGLMLHSNIAEVQAVRPVDPWFRNVARLAAERGLPVVGELFLGSASEEVEPLHHVVYPRIIYQQLAALRQVVGVVGVKEYYGLLPDRDDPNLAMAGLVFHEPTMAVGEALDRLAEPFGDARESILAAWEAVASGFELFPWDVSWLSREIGRLNPCHGWEAAIIRGQVADSPSWRSSRRSIFMVTKDELEPHPWLLEDVGLRYELAAAKFGQALDWYERALGHLPPDLEGGHLGSAVRAWMDDVQVMRRGARTYQLHIQETLVARHIRLAVGSGENPSSSLIAILRDLLELDVANQANAMRLGDTIATAEEMLVGFDRDPLAWVQAHLLPASRLRTPGNPFRVGLTTA